MSFVFILQVNFGSLDPVLGHANERVNFSSGPGRSRRTRPQFSHLRNWSSRMYKHIFLPRIINILHVKRPREMSVCLPRNVEQWAIRSLRTCDAGSVDFLEIVQEMYRKTLLLLCNNILYRRSCRSIFIVKDCYRSRGWTPNRYWKHGA